MRELTASVLTAITVLCPRQSAAHTFTGSVERVIDGDTICVKVEGGMVEFEAIERDGFARVRLAEIDAPELRTAGGRGSKLALEDMILHKTVTVEWKRRGKYRRIIGQVHVDDEWINLTMVRQGWATQFLRYSKCRQLAKAEGGARDQQAGLWHIPSSCKPTLDLALSSGKVQYAAEQTTRTDSAR
jgi:micrococcal nuclease